MNKLDSKAPTLSKPRHLPGSYLLLSFLIPAFIILAALVGLRTFPVGDNTLIISDARALYLEYLSYVGRLVKGQEGFVYSFEKGLGGNMMPHMGVTMLNPFFALFALFSIDNYPLAFDLVSLLNFSICGPAMYLLLADLYGHKRSNLIFSTTYALMGFNVANVFQVIFFTGVHALPLMVLGIRRIVQRKSPLLYILALGYAILTSYYFGFMLCAASVLFFCLLLWLHREELAGQKRKIFAHYALSSVCAGLLGMWVWLPALLGIRGGRLAQTSLTDFSFAENMPFLEMGAKLFTGANNTDQLQAGHPNIYVGLLPVALVILFFLNKNIDRRKKTAAGVAIGFYLLFFYINAFDMLMHGGTTTNWFNFRYSFIFSLILLVIAAEEWQHFESVPAADLRRCLVLMGIGTILIFSKRYGFVMGGEVLLDFALLALILLAFHVHRARPEANPTRIFEILTIFLVSFSLYLNYTICTRNLKPWTSTAKEYIELVNDVAPSIQVIQDMDDSFFRMEINDPYSGNCGNDPLLYGYNGVGHGGSNERNFVREGLQKLGLHRFDMRNYYAEGVPAATDALLGVRYVIAREDLGEEKGYTNRTSYATFELFKDLDLRDVYRSDDALGVAFLSGAEVGSVETELTDVFDNLNRTWAAVSTENRPVFVEENDISFEAVSFAANRELTAEEARRITSENDAKGTSDGSSSASEADEKDSSASGISGVPPLRVKEPPEFSSYIAYSFTASQDGPVYTYNRANLTASGSSQPVLAYEGYCHKGDVVRGYIPIEGDIVNRVGFEEIAGRFRAAYADLDALHALSEIVRSRPCTIEKIKDSHLRGEFTAEEGQLLMFTIPYDEGWTLTVDGNETEIKQVLGVFMAAEVEPGTHTYEMKFFPSGMKLGIIVSFITLLFLLFYLSVGRRLVDEVLISHTTAPTLGTTEADAGVNRRAFFKATCLDVIVIHFLFLGFCILMHPVHFETNDDLEMSMLLYGAYGSATDHLVFINILLGKLLMLLTIAIPSVAWYFWFQIICCIGAFISIGVVIKRRNPTVYWTTLPFFLLIIARDCYQHIQFTKTAGIVATAGILLIIDSFHNAGSKKRMRILGSVFLFVASLIRFDAALMICGVFGLSILAQFLHNSSQRRQIAAWWLCTLTVCMLAAQYNAAIYKRDPEWAGYMEFNSQRRYLSDWEMADWEYYTTTYADEYNMDNIDYNDVMFMRNWLFSDPEVFNTSFLNRALEAKNLTMKEYKHSASFIGNFLSKMFSYLKIEILVYYLLGFLAIWLLCSRKNIAGILGVPASLLFVLGYCFHIDRYWPHRTVFPILSASICLIVYTLSISGIITKKRLMYFLCALLAISSIGVALVFPYPSDDSILPVFDEIAEQEDVLFIMDPLDPRIESSFDARKPVHAGEVKNVFYTGTWLYPSPIVLDLLKTHGTENPWKDCVNNDKIIFVDNSRIDGRIDYLLEYVQNHYAPEAEAKAVGSLSGVTLYQIVTPNAAQISSDASNIPNPDVGTQVEPQSDMVI